MTALYYKFIQYEFNKMPLRSLHETGAMVGRGGEVKIMYTQKKGLQQSGYTLHQPRSVAFNKRMCTINISHGNQATMDSCLGHFSPYRGGGAFWNVCAHRAGGQAHTSMESFSCLIYGKNTAAHWFLEHMQVKTACNPTTIYKLFRQTIKFYNKKTIILRKQLYILARRHADAPRIPPHF